MSYGEAKDYFKDNLKRINYSSDPILRNLNGGLHNLSCTLEADMLKIRQALSKITTSLQRLERK